MSSASTSNGGVRSTIPPGISTHSSYHPKGYGVSEGLKRARRPFAVRNAITGSAILGFCTAVYFYSISKVSIEKIGLVQLKWFEYGWTEGEDDDGGKVEKSSTLC